MMRSLNIFAFQNAWLLHMHQIKICDGVDLRDCNTLLSLLLPPTQENKSKVALGRSAWCHKQRCDTDKLKIIKVTHLRPSLKYLAAHTKYLVGNNIIWIFPFWKQRLMYLVFPSHWRPYKLERESAPLLKIHFKRGAHSLENK